MVSGPVRPGEVWKSWVEFAFRSNGRRLLPSVRLARDAEEMNHHPDIDIRWNKVKLVLSTHSAGGLTDLDFLLARKIDKLGVTTKRPAADEAG